MDSVLVLNFSFEALNIVDLKRAVKLVFSGKAEVLHGGEGRMRSSSFEMRMPTTIRMLYFISRKRPRVPLTKKNVLLRDDYTCGYCGKHGERRMTVDHVIPKSKGGPPTWENLVAACGPCNTRKRDRTPAEAGMPLRAKPREPRSIPFLVVERNTTPSEWAAYLNLYNVRIEERLA